MKKSQAPIVIGAVILIVVAGFFLKKVSSSPGCEGQGPCMLYFYADD